MDKQEVREYLQELAYKAKEGTITKEEQALFDKWYNSYSDESIELPYEYSSNSDVIRDRMHGQLIDRIRKEKTVKKRTLTLWPRIAIAASALLFTSLLGYYIFNKRNVANQIAQIQEIKPGKNQATLTLANGQKLVLIKGLNGKLAQQGNTSIAVNSGNAIAYTSNEQKNTPVSYNTLSTARGEQSPYPLVLSDGTKVWLDAASSVTFPTEFHGRDRVVKLTGQGYFEVNHDVAHPFRVAVKNLMIEDIGTQFNIKAYEDEPTINTTLLNGSVRIVSDGANQQTVILKPGEVAVAGARLIVKDGDPEESISWKNGYFRFNDESIQNVMLQLSRWYNIDVEYVGTPPTTRFNAHISRYKNISQVLKVLSLTKMVHFQVEGRRVMVKQ